MDYTFVQGQKYLIGIPHIDTQKIAEIAQKFEIALPLAATLLARQKITDNDIQDFLVSSVSKDVADPVMMKDALRAAQRIEQAIKQGEKILIFGDYDVDGITSSSLMMVGLLSLGAQVNFYLPNRVKDGYGLSSKIVTKAKENNYSLIITVDNGITAFEPVRLAKELGIDVIITDHHRPHGQVPDAFAIVNPQQQDCAYPFKYFAGVGVAFKLIWLLYERHGMTIPGKVIELLLLGTVADVVPLTGENRYWVRYGLNYVNEHESYALQVLKENSKFEKPTLSSIDIGFSVTPQINALGRLDDPRQGVAFLIGQDAAVVDQVGRVLFQLNQARKDIERDIVQNIVDQVTSGQIDLSREKVIVAASAHWPAGVIGLVASRIVAAYGRPTILFHLTHDGIAKGSCRSIPEFNIFDALHENKELLIAFGGHSHAAGLSLKADVIAQLKERLEKKVAATLSDFDLKQKVRIDAVAKLSDFTEQFMQNLELFEPFGHANAQPYFYIAQVVLVKQPQLLKGLHVKCMVAADGVIKSLLFFNRPELFESLVNQADKPFAIIGQVSVNYWQGNSSIELIGLDMIVEV